MFRADSTYRPVLEHLEDRCLLAGGFVTVHLASDVPGLAPVTDTRLVNPWGIAFSPTGPFWLADNGSGVSDVLDGHGQPVPLVVAVGSGALPGTPTGIAFNGGPGFAIAADGISAPNRFLIATASGTIAGWSELVDPARAQVAIDQSATGAVYLGLALAASPGGESFLYAADFSQGMVDVFDQNFAPVLRPGAFRDPNLPAGFAPFNIQNIDQRLFVTYARPDAAGHDVVGGAGAGFIDVYDTAGKLLSRFASRGALDAPWGLALAPADFGPFSGAILVGNNGDGRINAYDRARGVFLGTLADDQGMPITIPNLWALTFGNGHAAGDVHTMFFAAGIDYDEHGVFGAIQAPGRRGADTAGTGVFDPSAPGEPSDYPLPPSGGPTLQSGNRSNLTVDLLPSRNVSLALIPTLTVTLQAGTTPATPNTSAPVSSIPLSGYFAAEAAAGTAPCVAADGDVESARGARRDAGVVAGYLEERASQQLPRRRVESLTSVATPTIDTVDVDWIDAPSTSFIGPTDTPPQPTGPNHWLTWTQVMPLIVVIGIPAIWWYWAKHTTIWISASIAARQVTCRRGES